MIIFTRPEKETRISKTQRAARERGSVDFSRPMLDVPNGSSSGADVGFRYHDSFTTVTRKKKKKRKGGHDATGRCAEEMLERTMHELRTDQRWTQNTTSRSDFGMDCEGASTRLTLGA